MVTAGSMDVLLVSIPFVFYLMYHIVVTIIIAIIRCVF